MNIKFHKPYHFEGVNYASIHLDLDSLTGNMVIQAENNLRSSGDMSPVYEMAPRFGAEIAALVSKQPIEFFLGLPASDFMRIGRMVRSFLLNGSAEGLGEEAFNEDEEAVVAQ